MACNSVVHRGYTARTAKRKVSGPGGDTLGSGSGKVERDPVRKRAACDTLIW